MSLTTFTSAEHDVLNDRWTWLRFAFAPGGAIGITALWLELPDASVGWTALWLVFTSYCMFCWTSCFHEVAHQTLTRNRSTSIWIGRAIGTAILVPYTIYRESHIRHHAYLNKPYDWELWPYSDPKCSLWFRRVFLWVDLVFGSFTAMYTFGRIFWHRDTPLKDAAIRRTIWLEYLAAALIWSSILASVHLFDAWHGFLMGWVATSLIGGVIQNGRKFTEHLGMKSYDPLHGTRTVVGDNWFTRLCTFLNFDIFIHWPHPRHPRVAHRRLKDKMYEYAAAAPELQYPMFRTYRAAVLDPLPYLFKNHGVGMNAGAADPHTEKQDADNFVADVVEDVLADQDRLTPTICETSATPAQEPA